MQVKGEKPEEAGRPTSARILESRQQVTENLRPYWPLSVRQVHYKLLNNPPLTQTTKKKNERWRYKNNLDNYGKWVSI
jgi:hypothetical protein